MTDDLADLHERALAAAREVVAGIGIEQWRVPTPCEGWDVRTLLNHLVAGNLWVAPLMTGQSIAGVGDRLDGDVLGHDPLAAYEASAQEAAATFQAPGAMEVPAAVSYGPVPGRVYAGHRLIEAVVHGWDLATATGQDATIGPELAQATWDVIEPQRADLQASGAFRPARPVGPGASVAERLLAVVGRSG
ncbi:MAG: TIGR03086 family metal-binding protein [Acidimicrobiales bacterium]